MDNITPPLSFKTHPEGRGVIWDPLRGDSPYGRGINDIVKTPPPLPVVDLYVYIRFYFIIQI
jgi:hypothetical protein